MIIYSSIHGPRLRYAGDFLGSLLFDQPCIYTNDVLSFKTHDGLRINYSDERIDDSYWIKPYGLLGEKATRTLDVKLFDWQGLKAFFATDGDHHFDILSAIFYLLSRFEEYIPHETDSYGRFSYKSSLAFKGGFLHEPLIDEWVLQLKLKFLQEFPGVHFAERKFNFLPTYDIDEAWSFQAKQTWLTYAGMTRDIWMGKWKRVQQRLKVRRGKSPDPFDSYAWMDEMNRKHSLDPLYFFLVAEKRSKYDRNIDPHHPAFIRLVKRHASVYRTGLHPSWRSGDNSGILQEKTLLEDIIEKKVVSSRQHFIRFTLPGTYRELIKAGITEEYSMGYGSINGFRASTSFPFYWYDLEREEQTSLKVLPFCFMDANCFFEQKQTPQMAEMEMRSYYDKVKAVHGQFISIWHNTFLGTDPLFRGWREAYSSFLDGIR